MHVLVGGDGSVYACSCHIGRDHTLAVDYDASNREAGRYISLECEGGEHGSCKDNVCYCDHHIDTGRGARKG